MKVFKTMCASYITLELFRVACVPAEYCEPLYRVKLETIIRKEMNVRQVSLEVLSIS